MTVFTQNELVDLTPSPKLRNKVNSRASLDPNDLDRYF